MNKYECSKKLYLTDIIHVRVIKRRPSVSRWGISLPESPVLRVVGQLLEVVQAVLKVDTARAIIYAISKTVRVSSSAVSIH